MREASRAAQGRDFLMHSLFVCEVRGEDVPHAESVWECGRRKWRVTFIVRYKTGYRRWMYQRKPGKTKLTFAFFFTSDTSSCANIFKWVLFHNWHYTRYNTRCMHMPIKGVTCCRAFVLVWLISQRLCICSFTDTLLLPACFPLLHFWWRFTSQRFHLTRGGDTFVML